MYRRNKGDINQAVETETLTRPESIKIETRAHGYQRKSRQNRTNDRLKPRNESFLDFDFAVKVICHKQQVQVALLAFSTFAEKYQID